MPNVVAGITLTADGKGLVGQVRLSRKELDRLAGAVEKTGKGAGRQASRFRRLQNQFKRTAERAKAASQAMVGLKAAIAGLALGYQLKRATETALAFERIDLALKAATGSTYAARKEFEFVARVSEELGLNLQSAAANYANLAAAAKGTALEGRPLQEIFEGIAAASGALSLSAEDQSGVLKAVEQIISKGTVSSEELRQQMGERLPGAFQLAAVAMGVTTEQLNKMLSLGKVTAEDLLPKLGKALRERYGQAAIDAADGANSAFNRFQNSLDQAQLAFASSGFLEPVTEALGEIRDFLDSDDTREGLKEFSENLGNAFKYMVENADQILKVMAAFAGFRAGSAFGPIGAVVGGVAGYGAVAYALSPGGGTSGAPLARPRGGIRATAAATQRAARQWPALPAAYARGAQTIGELYGPAAVGSDRYYAELADQYRRGEAARLARGAPDAAAAAPNRPTVAADAIDKALAGVLKRERALLPDLERREIETREWAASVKKAVRDAGGDWNKYSARVERVIGSELAALYAEDAERQREAAAAAAEERREAWLESLRASESFFDGVRLGARRIRDEMKTAADETADAFERAFAGLENTIADFARTGKLEIGNLVKSILSDLARIAIRQSITAPIGAYLGEFFGGTTSETTYTGGARNQNGGLIPVPQSHTGGLIDRVRPMSAVDRAAFVGAPAYHGGGIAGLGHNEVPAILQRGEEVLTREDPRHVLNTARSVRVEIVNRGRAAQVESAEVRPDAAGEVLRIVLGDLDSNGPVSQRLAAAFGGRQDF